MSSHEPSRCADAVVVIPGLMGSQLVDGNGTLVWGLRPRLLARQLLHGDVLQRLRVRCDDGIRPQGLLSTPALIPWLGSLDPYTPLVRALRANILTHPDALLQFAYDWRFSIADIAAELGRAAEAHLQTWRKHSRGDPRARLWLVCHSLGGLAARYFTEVLGGGAIVHQTVTLGTPHYGSLKAFVALANGHIGPHTLLANQVRELARSMPSMYELAPRYACLSTTAPDPLRRLTSADFDAIGADPAMAHAANDVHHTLDSATKAAGANACVLRARVGITQPTAQSATICGGEVILRESIHGEDRGGDGSVYRDAATPIGVQPDYIPQRHGRLASATEAIGYVHAVLTERPQGPPMAATEGIGIDLPATIPAGKRLTVRIVCDPGRRVLCNAIDQDTGRQVAAVLATPSDGHLTAQLMIPRPGLYAIQAKSGGYSAVGESILVNEPAGLSE